MTLLVLVGGTNESRMEKLLPALSRGDLPLPGRGEED
jgi:hypothetical protein